MDLILAVASLMCEPSNLIRWIIENAQTMSAPPGCMLIPSPPTCKYKCAECEAVMVVVVVVCRVVLYNGAINIFKSENNA